MKSLMVAAAGVAVGILLTSAVCRAHAGHNHGAQAQRERESSVQDHRPHESRGKVKSGAYVRSLQAPPRPAPGKPRVRIDGFASTGEMAREIRDPVKK